MTDNARSRAPQPASSLLFDPADARSTREALDLLSHAPNRTLGQNFLVNRAARDRICDVAALEESDSVLEIGPGLGSLSCELARQAALTVAIEKDSHFAAFLRPALPESKFRLVEGDALRVSWDDLGLPDAGVKVVANLPYSVSKPLLRRLLEEWRPHFSTLTVMVQREVADRLTAAPDTENYGPMALMATLHSRAKRQFDLAPGSFMPPPTVTSSVVHLVVRDVPSVHLDDEPFFWRVVHAAFGQRRKQLGNTLRAVEPDRDKIQAALASCDIDSQRRGETLSLPEFAALSHALRAS